MKVTFTIPTYNKGHYLAESIESALSQTHKDIEVIIYDDRSMDGSEFLCKHYTANHSNVKYFRSNFNIGVGVTRNMAWHEATGDIICVQDGDDISPENRAELVVKFFEENEDTDILYGSCGLIDGMGVFRNRMPAEDFSISKLKKDNYIQHPTVAYRRNLPVRYRAVRYIDDWYFYLDCVMENIKFSKINDILGFYRPLNEGLTLKKGYKNNQKAMLRNSLIEEFSDIDDDVSKQLFDKNSTQYVRMKAIERSVPEGSKVLDVGCNGGSLLHHLKQQKKCKCYGYEIARNLVTICNQKDLDVIREDILKFVMEDAEFDRIILGDILEHYIDVDVKLILENCAKMLKKGGSIVVTVPSKYGFYSKEHNPDHKRDYEADDFRDMFINWKIIDKPITVKDYAVPMWLLVTITP